AQPDAARSARGQAAEIRAVHATLRPFLRPQSAEDARRADPAPGAADGADGILDAVPLAGDAPADAGSDRDDPQRSGAAGADGRARRPVGAVVAASRPGQPLRVLRLGVAAAAGSAVIDGAPAGHGGPRIRVARGLPGPAANAGAVRAAAAIARVGRPPGGGPDERA